LPEVSLVVNETTPTSSSTCCLLIVIQTLCVPLEINIFGGLLFGYLLKNFICAFIIKLRNSRALKRQLVLIMIRSTAESILGEVQLLDERDIDSINIGAVVGITVIVKTLVTVILLKCMIY
jgi:hypothetical protein